MNKRHWPRTINGAVKKLMKELRPSELKVLAMMQKKTLHRLHHSLGMSIRNKFGLWDTNRQLRKSCNSSHPDECSHKIIEALWIKAHRRYNV